MGILETIDQPQTRKLSVDDLFAMVEAGILREDERVELFDGVLLRKNAKNIRHETMRMRLAHWLSRNVSDAYIAGSELGARFTDTLYLEPDIIVVDASVQLDQLNPDTVPLVIEIADTTLAYDAGAKRDRYAGLGLPEYWVVDLNGAALTRYTAPVDGRYTGEATSAFDAPVSPQFAPGLQLNIATVLGE